MSCHFIPLEDWKEVIQSNLNYGRPYFYTADQTEPPTGRHWTHENVKDQKENSKRLTKLRASKKKPLGIRYGFMGITISNHGYRHFGVSGSWTPTVCTCEQVLRTTSVAEDIRNRFKSIYKENTCAQHLPFQSRFYNLFRNCLNFFMILKPFRSSAFYGRCCLSMCTYVALTSWAVIIPTDVVQGA